MPTKSSRPKVYVETTVFSYLAARASRDPITAARQVMTRHWWDRRRHNYTLLISAAVEAECRRGDAALAGARSRLLKTASLFPLNKEIMELAKLLMRPSAIPKAAGVDAVHIAAAAVAECEFLLTWNFRHIANVRIRREVERILARHGYRQTTICTPEELF